MSGAPGQSPWPDRKYPEGTCTYIYLSGLLPFDFNILNFVQQSGPRPPPAILIFGEFAGSERDGQRVASAGLLPQRYG